MYEYIETIKPYFYSLREINTHLSLDIKLPLNWKHDNIVLKYKGITSKTQDKTDKFNLLSLISQSTKDGCDMIMSCALEIIKVNLEEEEKRKLFDEKVNELKLLFKKESLDILKDINLLKEYGQEITTSIGMAEQGDREGQEGDREE